jgi:hypothetical protein
MLIIVIFLRPVYTSEVCTRTVSAITLLRKLVVDDLYGYDLGDCLA